MRDTRKTLDAICKDTGLYYHTYGPGDGLTRYRFFDRLTEDGKESDYFGPLSGLETCLGLPQAILFARGYRNGHYHAANAGTPYKYG